MYFEEGGYYHIFNRGLNKEKIFFSSANYDYLLKRIKRTYKKYKISIIAFCLMPNHYHFLLRQDSEIEVSDWLRVLFSGYVLALNKEQNISGNLFEGKPKKRTVNRIDYLQHLIYYIHYNPVMAGIVNHPSEWNYSNYLECIGHRYDLPFNKSEVCDLFGSLNEYELFAENYLIDDKTDKQMEKYYID